MKVEFDAELRGADGVVLPAHCELQPPSVGGQKSLVRVAVPASRITENVPSSPCVLSGTSGPYSIRMEEVYWRHFPTSANSTFGLETIELFHVGRLMIRRPSGGGGKEIRFHLAPISYLRSESSFASFGDGSRTENLFVLDLPGLGQTRFVIEWVTTYHRDAEIPGATVIVGFDAIVDLPSKGISDAGQLVEQFKGSLEILSVLFRQAVTLHGWTYTHEVAATTWTNPLDPNVTPSARERRGDFVSRPQIFEECATALAQAYGTADAKSRSLVRHLSVAVNPHNNSSTSDHFLFMFAALERVIEFAWTIDKEPSIPAITTQALIQHLEKLSADVTAAAGEYAAEISQRLKGLIGVVSRPSVRDKFDAFVRVYPAMNRYCADLWPVLGSDKERGLRDIRNALAHGRSSFVSSDVVAVAEWHLAVLLERLIFVLLGLAVPDGISTGSLLLRTGGRGWYESDWWIPLRSRRDKSI